MAKKEENEILGGSRLVPSVQELVKNPISTVPARYIQHDYSDGDADEVKPNQFNSGSDVQPEVPTIDFAKLLSQQKSNNYDELTRLHLACKEWGFFQVINHGVSSSLLEKIKTEVRDFFNLPAEDKKRFWQRPGDLEGFGQAFVASDDQKLDWADVFILTMLPIHLRKPRLLPKLPMPFKEDLETYSMELKNLALALLTQLENALKLEAKALTNLYEDGMQTMRMNYYPPCPQPEKVIGCTTHSDATGLTILFQVNDTPGLQVKKDGVWETIMPIPGAFIVNVGDMLEIQTNGTYRSIVHRAITNSVKERISVATFYQPSVDVELCPATSLITEETPAAYKTISGKDFVKAFFKNQARSPLGDIKI